MKTNDDHPTMLRLQTISECLRVQPVTGPAHSIGKPDVPDATAKIHVRFAATLPQALQIRRRKKKDSV